LQYFAPSDNLRTDLVQETGLSSKSIKKLLAQPADTKVKTVSFWLVDTGEHEVKLDYESSDHGWFTVNEALLLQLYPGTKTFFEKVNSGEISLQ
jgi:hypothetical protein